MGASAAAAVVVAIAAAITLLPALMGLMGEKLRPLPGSKAHQLASMSAATPSMGRRWVRFVMKKPLIVTLVSIAGLTTLAIPALELDLNLPSGASEPRDSTQRKAFDYVSEGFGPGYNGPLVIAVDITRTDEIIETLEGLRVDLAAVPGVDYVSEGFPSPTIDTGLFQAIPTSGPDSRETKELVTLMRESFPEMEAKWNVDLAVTGVTAIGVDVSQRIQSALIPFGLVVVGLSFLLLLVVFRSLLVPLKAALGFILSVTAAFGVVVAVFQWGWGSSLVGVDTPGPILSFMPIILMAVLFGLGHGLSGVPRLGDERELCALWPVANLHRRGIHPGVLASWSLPHSLCSLCFLLLFPKELRLSSPSPSASPSALPWTPLSFA